LGAMEGLGAEMGCSNRKLLVTWALGLGGGVAVISKGEARMRENLTALGSCGGGMSGEELVRRLGVVGNDARFYQGDCFAGIL